MSRHTCASYVGTILTMVMIVHHGSCLSMSRNHATIKTLVVNLSTYTPEPSQHCNSICYDDDDDDEEKTIPLRDIISQLPSSIVINTYPPILPIEDPEDSLIMRDEDLNTITKKETYEVIKSNVEDFVPIPSQSEDTSMNDSECDLPFCDNSMTFSNPLFDSNDDVTSSDDESLSDEDVPEDNASYDSNLDEPALLVTPLFDSNEEACFDPGDDIELLLHHDPSTPKMSVASILDGFINELPLKRMMIYLIWNLKRMNGRRFLDSPVLLSSRNEDTIFDPDIFAF
nr:hypothetical protein [Tanacetum cinerariifolium]